MRDADLHNVVTNLRCLPNAPQSFLKPSEVSGAISSHLEHLEAIWSHLSYLEASGSIWKHLESSAAIWSHLEPSGVIGSHHEATWSHLEPLEPLPPDHSMARMKPGDPEATWARWISLEQFRNIYIHLESSGAVWDQLERSGVI
jgi:hypothetical protein